jgi:hypothetical protein
MGSKSGKTSSSPDLRTMWGTGEWKRKCSCKTTSQLLYMPRLAISTYLHHSLEVRHTVEIVRSQWSATNGCPDRFYLSSKPHLYLLVLRKLPKHKTRGIRHRLVTRQEECTEGRIRSETSRDSKKVSQPYLGDHLVLRESRLWVLGAVRLD